MADVCLRASDRAAHLEVTVAISTNVCRDAQKAHALATTGTIGLGRLLTAVGLVALTSKRPGTTSIQLLSRGRLKQLYVDATEDGHLRGYSKTPKLEYPPVPKKPRSGRLSIAAVALPGQVSVVRSNESGEYGQSAAPMTSGEVDRDVEGFLVQSDQIPTVLVCETLLGVDGSVERAGGVLIQAMPDGDLDTLIALRDRVVDGGLASLLYDHDGAEKLLAAIAPTADIVDAPLALSWQCRCSLERVENALRLAGPQELAEMVGSNESAKVDCDFCGQHYEVPPARVAAIFKATIKAQG